MRAERAHVGNGMRGCGRALILLICLGIVGPALANPAFDYLLHCGGCHLEDGAGAPPAVPDLRDSLGTLAGFAAGRAYIVRVPGAAQAPIDDAALAGVLNWMLASFTNAADVEPFTREEVSGYRGQPLLDPLAARRKVLAADTTSGHRSVATPRSSR